MAAFIASFLLLSLIPASYQDWSMDTRNYPPGENDILMYCYHRNENRDTLYMTVEIRPNKQHEWISVQYMNASGSYRTEEYHGREPYPFLSVTIDKTDDCLRGLVCVTYLEASVQLDSCIIDSDRFPTYRCRAFNGRSFDVSPEMNIVESIEGLKPANMKDLVIEQQPISRTNIKARFDDGDVLQLQCTGEVANINSTVEVDIRWCKKQNGKFSVFQLQDDPITSIVQRSNNGCTIMQESVIFYHITNQDTNLEIMCESPFYTNDGDECDQRYRGINLKLDIPTAITRNRENEWSLSPILIYGEKARLNLHLVEVDGSGTTIHLLSKASSFSLNSSLSTKINWCVKNQNDDTWTKLTNVRDIIEATSNSNGKINIFSEMKYHVDIHVSDTNTHIMCELSYSHVCGYGLASSSVSLHAVVGKGIFPSSGEENKWSMSPILIYNRTTRLNPDFLEISGAGATISLLSTASVDFTEFRKSKYMINWCVQKQNDKTWRKVILQENMTDATSTTHREMKIFSEIRYHVSIFDRYVHFLSEISNSSTCGSGVASSQVLLKMFVEEIVWRMSPIVLYNQDTLLSPQLNGIDGDGTTIHLLSSASIIIFKNLPLANIINWCVRKQTNKTWTKVVPRGMTEATSNSSGEIKIFSEIRYHLSSLNSDIQFLCEISYSSKCGTGLAASNVTLHSVVNVVDKELHYKCTNGANKLNDAELSSRMAWFTVVTLFLALILICILICLAVLCRRKEMHLFGWIVKISSEQHEMRPTVAEWGSSYENQVYSSVLEQDKKGGTVRI